MKSPVRKLQQLKGIGPVTACRLVDAGITSFTAIVSMGESGLSSIAGINPGSIPAILAQAANLSVIERGVDTVLDSRREDHTVAVNELHTVLQEIAVAAADRFSKGRARKVNRNMVACLDGLTALENLFGQYPNRCDKTVLKVRKRLSGLSAADPKQLRKGLKRTRKALKWATSLTA